MAMNENIGGAEPAEAKSRTVRSRLHPLHEAALRLAGVASTNNPARQKSRDIVAMLLCHGARAWRGAQPKVRIHLYTVCTESRKSAVRIRLG